jgi:tetratricopeptide (TPR) repeat protein
VRTVAIIAVLLLAAPASAQTGEEAARQAAEGGRRSYNLGQWPEAIAEFEKAYRLSGDPALLFNLAQAHRRAGHTSEAMGFYKAFLREQPMSENREVAEKQLKELSAQTGVQQPPPVVEPAALAHTAAAPALTIAASSPAPPPEAQTPLPRWLPLAGAAVTLAATASAIAYGVSASNRYDDLAASCGNTAPGCTAAQIDEVRSRDRTATILWIVAGVIGAGTGITAYVNARAAGVSALWRF